MEAAESWDAARVLVVDQVERIVRCTNCVSRFAVASPDDDLSLDLAEVAQMTGAVDFFREARCPDCGATVKVRPSRFSNAELLSLVAEASEAIREDKAEWSEQVARRKWALGRE